MGKRFRGLTQTATDADFVEGNYFGVDTPSVTKKVPANLIAKQSALETTNSNVIALTTYAQNVAHSIAPPFDPTRDSEHAYPAGYSVTYTDGKVYTFCVDHYGAWDASHVVLFEKFVDKFRKLDNDVGVYDIGTTYNTLDATYSRVMAVFPIKDVNSTFVWKILNKSTNGKVNIRVTSAATPYAADILETAATVGSSDTSGDGSFTISAENKSAAKYIVVLNATANLLVSFNLELCTKLSVDGELKETKSLIDFLNDATIISQTRFVQGGINGTTGEDAASNGTVRPDTHIDVDDLVSVSLGSFSGLHVQLYSYNASGSYLGRNDLGASAFSFNSKQIKAFRNAKFVTFGIYLDGGGNFSPSDLATNGTFSIKLTTISTIPKMNKNTNTDFSLMLKSVGSTPMATWIDDDGVVTHTNGGISGVVVPVAEAVGIPVTFAVIPPLGDSVVVGGVTMTRGEYFNILQNKGHQIVSHPEHTYWYGTNYNLDKVKETLIESLQDLQEYKMLHSDMMVYPGSSGANSDVVEQVRKWCMCGVLSGYGTPNHLGDSTKWAIKRTFVNFADYYSLHSSDPGFVSSMVWYKSQVDAAFANGDWIIFGTHSYQFTTSEDTTDPNANTLGNLKELMQYSVTKGLEFRTLWDVYNRRRFLFEFNEINQ